MVQPDSLLEPTFDIGAIRAGESYFLDCLVYLDFFLFGAEVQAHEVLRVACGGGLCKVDHIDGRFSLVYQLLNFGRNFRGAVAEVKRHRPLRGAHGHGLAPGMLREVAFKKFGRTDGRAHQQESGLRERQERYLPGDAALAVGIVVEFVHYHVHDVELFALVERHIGKNFSRAAEDGSVVVHGRIAGRKSHVLGPEFLAERHPLLVHQSLDGTGVHTLAPMHDAVEVERQGDHRFAATCGRVQYDVLAVQEFEDGFFLCGVERGTA